MTRSAFRPSPKNRLIGSRERQRAGLPSQVAALANRLLDRQELKVASDLAAILGDDESLEEALVGSMVDRILPAYWEIQEDRPDRVDPSPIFRPLYQLHGYSNLADFGKFTNDFVKMAEAHLEACLHWLTPYPPAEWSGGKDFDRLIVGLEEEKVLPPRLARDLRSFDRLVNVASASAGSLDQPRFSIEDAAQLLMITRKLSIQLFDVLKSRGVTIEHPWPPLKT